MILGYERHDYAEVENDISEWICSGCLHLFGLNDRSPQLEIDDAETNSTLLFCGDCVEDRRFPQPTEDIPIIDCPECDFPLSNADRLLMNTRCISVCAFCEAEKGHAESIWRARWDRLWVVAAAVWIGVCAIAVMVAGVLR